MSVTTQEAFVVYDAVTARTMEMDKTQLVGMIAFIHGYCFDVEVVNNAFLAYMETHD